MGEGVESYVPPEAVDLAEDMVAVFGPQAIDVARAKLQARMSDGLPRRVDLYAAVCALLIERAPPRPRGWATSLAASFGFW
jgi:hypothetical protein